MEQNSKTNQAMNLNELDGFQLENIYKKLKERIDLREIVLLQWVERYSKMYLYFDGEDYQYIRQSEITLNENKKINVVDYETFIKINFPKPIKHFKAKCAFSGAWRIGQYKFDKGNHIIVNDKGEESIVLVNTIEVVELKYKLS